MKEENKGKERFLNELKEMRQRIADLEAAAEEHKRTEDALIREKEKFRILVEDSPLGVSLIGKDGRYKYINDKFVDMFGYTLEDIPTGREWFRKAYPDPRYKDQIISTWISDLKETTIGESQPRPFSVTCKDGAEKVIRFRPVSMETGERLVIYEDITEIKRVEDELIKHRNHLEELIDERTNKLKRINERLLLAIKERKQAEEELKESSEKIKLFAYSVSHDLKSPAIGIYGLTKLLHKHCSEILDEKGKSYCDQVLKASEQIVALVEQINVYISTKETPLSTEKVKLKEILLMVREEFSTQLNIRQITWREPEHLPDVNADRFSILRVLRNLVDNALKYGGDDLSQIKIGYRETDEHHILYVKDDGFGLKEEDTKKIFRVFMRKRTSKGIEGTGLGLAIVKEIAEQHKGKAWVKPGRKRGITFYLSISKYLPLS
ncbi:MAG: PAS domain S-box protein [Desulfobacteraceae bacterium]|nr:MAG: PAS domain S-box protein [Desulfobacteraceae bacterium]